MPKHVVIIGGGIAGLATAIQLKDRTAAIPEELKVTVLEADAHLGGNIHSDHCDGFTIERGPNGYLDNVPAMARLVERLGLSSEIQKADDSAAKRFLYRNGRLHALPTGPLSFLKSRVLSPRGRLRLLLEPFARARPESVDETIHEFASRRIGTEAAKILIDAMISGVFAGNTRELSLASALPKMAAMETEHGSLFRAMLAKKKQHAQGTDGEARPGGPAGPGGILTSFRPGLGVLIDSLEHALKGAIRHAHRVTAIEPIDATGSTEPVAGVSRWRTVSAGGETLEADAVVLAIPSAAAAPLLRPVDQVLGETAGQIPSAGVAVVALGFDAPTIGGPPDGFGFLVPRNEGLRILGCLWDSSIFPGRAPTGQVLLRLIVGGAHDPLAAELDDESLLAIVREDAHKTMGLDASPILTRIYRHRLGIAQYVRGHQQRLDKIHEHLHKHSGLWIAGSSYYGISMNACVEQAEHQAEEILTSLGLSPQAQASIVR